MIRRESCSSVVRTCPAKALCSGPSASTQCSPWRERQSAPILSSSRLFKSARESTAPTPCKKAAPLSSPKSCTSAESSTSRAPRPTQNANAANGAAATDPESRALLFLFDELLEGTNSKDRRIGAERLIQGLLQRGAIGIVTTHDLALTEITAAVGDVIRNVHFEDQVEGNEMRFDYQLREGVVTKSNAIALMRIIGLDM